jgi:acyl transferase domain-containing protein
MRIVFAFSGQGSQRAAMGASLYHAHAGFRASLDRIDAIARAMRGGRSLLTEMFAARKGDAFDALLDTHPGIVAVEIALASVLRESGLEPDVVVGASLGEIAAIAISGALSIEDAVALAIRQADAIVERCEEGAILAVVARAELVRSLPLPNAVEIACADPPAVVLAVPRAAIEESFSVLRGAKLPFERLAVRYAFHSAAIDAAREAFVAGAKATLRAPRIPVATTSAGGLVDRLELGDLWTAVRAEIQLAAALRAAAALAGPDAVFVDVGPSSTMAVAAKHVLRVGAQAILSDLDPLQAFTRVKALGHRRIAEAMAAF